MEKRKFHDKELQRQYEEWEDYVNSHAGQAYRCMDFDEWRRRQW